MLAKRVTVGSNWLCLLQPCLACQGHQNGTVCAQEAQAEAADRSKYPLDPEHLICNGLGGAFLHPTHVFALARFAPIAGRDADDAFVHGTGPKPSFKPGAQPATEAVLCSFLTAKYNPHMQIQTAQYAAPASSYISHCRMCTMISSWLFGEDAAWHRHAANSMASTACILLLCPAPGVNMRQMDVVCAKIVPAI